MPSSRWSDERRARSSASCTPRAFVYPLSAPTCFCFGRRNRYPAFSLYVALIGILLLAFRCAKEALWSTCSPYTVTITGRTQNDREVAPRLSRLSQRELPAFDNAWAYRELRSCARNQSTTEANSCWRTAVGKRSRAVLCPVFLNQHHQS